MESANRDEVKKRIADMGAFLREQSTEITEYDESLVRRLIEKVRSSRTDLPWNLNPV